MVHFYKDKRYSPLRFQALCDRAWHSVDEVKWPDSPKQFISVAHRVTCPACLDILIPKHEEFIALMRASRAKTSASNASAPNYTPSSSLDDRPGTEPASQTEVENV